MQRWCVARRSRAGLATRTEGRSSAARQRTRLWLGSRRRLGKRDGRDRRVHPESPRADAPSTAQPCQVSPWVPTQSVRLEPRAEEDQSPVVRVKERCVATSSRALHAGAEARQARWGSRQNPTRRWRRHPHATPTRATSAASTSRISTTVAARRGPPTRAASRPRRHAGRLGRHCAQRSLSRCRLPTPAARRSPSAARSRPWSRGSAWARPSSLAGP